MHKGCTCSGRRQKKSRFFQLIFVARLIRLARRRQIEQKNITYPCSLPASKRAEMALWRGFFIVVGFGNYKQTSSKVGCTKTSANFAFDDINIVRLKMKGLNGRKYQHSQGGVIDFAPIFFAGSANGVQIFYGIHDSGRAIRNAADSAQFGQICAGVVESAV